MGIHIVCVVQGTEIGPQRRAGRMRVQGEGKRRERNSNNEHSPGSIPLGVDRTEEFPAEVTQGGAQGV